MISYLEGVVMRDAAGSAVVVETTKDGAITGMSRVPASMHPLSARGIGHRMIALERAATRGARIVLTLEHDPDGSILEIDEISPVTAPELAAARAWLNNAQTAQA